MDTNNELQSTVADLSRIQITACENKVDCEELGNSPENDNYCANCNISEEIEYSDASVYMVEDIEKEVHLMNEKLKNSQSSFDSKLLPKLELEINRIATSVDGLTENLTGLLHSISALTLDCLNTYGKAICKTCDAVDYNIKLMYQLMAKCEEVSKIAEPLYELQHNVRDVKHVLDLLENAVNV